MAAARSFPESDPSRATSSLPNEIKPCIDLGWTGPDPPRPPGELVLSPVRASHQSPSDHLESGDNEGPPLDLFIEPVRGSCWLPGGARTPLGAQIPAAKLEESEEQGRWGDRPLGAFRCKGPPCLVQVGPGARKGG